ncbi:carboxypeptidase-like regulatory domain-containing protein [Spirosoma luteum]|uniref:carboxypeptidase-like regulatory domain-containing protein n=1 Tax=Spirosoma luteum TaxID=431553 RepID=UPI0003823A16|nr:carboxypeptidase-like regulatory domain-containing protein [Spirosoma luteum]
MKKSITCSVLFLGIAVLFSTAVLAQTEIAGKVTDEAKRDELAGISIAVKGKVIGTITDQKGNFSLSTSTPTPFTIAVSGVGFQTQDFVVNGSRRDLNVSLKEQVLLGQEVVVSASRVEESVLKSPVSVEKMSLRDIQTTPAANFYDGLANIKGVDIATQGLLFKSINLRGFGATGNPRTVQLIDGMDNSAPGLNFPIDNIAGVPEQDVESVEILPGAASALYGPNAIQGLILLTSKSPFLYQGLSANVKTGIMSASNRTTANTGFYDASIRYAKAFNNKLAFKLNLAYIKAQDWEATNYTDLNNPTNATNTSDRTATAPNYDGMNIYGDENQQNLRTVGQALIAANRLPAAALALFPNTNVSRTGYQERDVVDYNTKSLKINGALHYRITDKIEAIGQINYGFGTTVYTANGRYSLRDFSLTQAKLELRGDNFTLRAYTTQERSGKSYTAGLATVYLNEAWKPSQQWFGEYAGAYAQARGGGQADAAAQLTARGVADQGRPVPGSDAFNTLLNAVSTGSITTGKGGAFEDNSNLYHAEGLYNFKNQVKFADVLVGANVRQYQLVSNGTLFADQVEDRNGKIKINEFGAFIQASKSLFADHLKITASTRYDKNQNFKGQFTPRVSAVASFGEHNIRLSYQTGFRIPTTQNQYIDLQTPQARLLGGLPEFYDRFNLGNSYSRANVTAVGAAITATGSDPAFQAQQVQALTGIITPQVVSAVTAQVTAGVTAQVNAAVAAGQLPAAAAAAAIQQGVAAQLATPAVQGLIAQNVTAQVTANAPSFIQAQAVGANLGGLKPYQRKEFKPERVASYEIGYRSVFNKRLLVDAYYYYSVYTNFIGGVILLQPTASLAPGLLSIASGVFSGGTRKVYSVAANSSEQITASGWAIGLNYALNKGYGLSGNLANNQLNNFVPTEELQTSGFNTPKYRWNLGFTKRAVGGSNIGFGIAFKHQSSFEWQGFGQPTEVGVPLYSNTIVPVINNLDAQVNYKVQSLKSIIKVGATNLFGKPYFQAYGSPYIGTTYYVGLTFDELLN